MNAISIDSTDFSLDADFFDQFDKHPAHRDAPDDHLVDEVSILEPDNVAMRLFRAFGNIMFLCAIFAVSVGGALAVAANISLLGSWQLGDFGILSDIAGRLLG